MAISDTDGRGGKPSVLFAVGRRLFHGFKQIEVGEVDFQLGNFFLCLLDFPHRLAPEPGLERVDLVVHEFLDRLGHGLFIGHFDHEQESLTLGRDRHFVIGHQRHALTEMGDEILADVDLWAIGISLQSLQHAGKGLFVTGHCVE